MHTNSATAKVLSRLARTVYQLNVETIATKQHLVEQGINKQALDELDEHEAAFRNCFISCMFYLLS